jgi:predicted membrane GTPase involved in stress response
VTVDVDEEFSGTVVQKIAERRGDLVEMTPSGGGKQRAGVLHVPTRGLIGYHGEFLTDTRGTGIMNRAFLEYAPAQGRDPRPAYRGSDLDEPGRCGGLCAVEPGRSRTDDDRAGHTRSMKA